MHTQIVGTQEQFKHTQGYKYMYQDFKGKRLTYIYEDSEAGRTDKQAVAKFIDKCAKKDLWLSGYIQQRYASKMLDGQTERDYMIHRHASLLSTLQGKASWGNPSIKI